MRARAIPASAGLLAVLAFGSLWMPPARRSDARAQEASIEKAKRRDDLIKLRVELGLMQLDADAERDALLDLMKIERGLEANEIAANLIAGTPVANDRNHRSMLDLKKKTAEAYRPLIERNRKVYAERLKAIAGKRLEVEDLERSSLDAK